MDKKPTDPVPDQPVRKRARPEQQEREAQALAAKRAENLRLNLMKRKVQTRARFVADASQDNET